MRVRYSIKPAIYGYLFILNTNNRCLVFAMSRFVLNIFSSMLSIFELCQRKQGSCLVYIRDISDYYTSRITQDLQFIFRVVIRNTIIKSSQIETGI
jgi:hypothetical protein